MVRDRISELQACRKNGSNFGGGLLQDVQVMISSNKKISNILEKAAEIRESIELMMVNIDTIKGLHNNVLSHTNPDIRTELDGRTSIVDVTAARIHKQLKELIGDTQSVDDFTMLESARDGPTYVRIRVLQYTTMKQLFAEIMLDYNESLLRYHEKCSALLNQQRVLIRQASSNGVYYKEDANEEKTSLFVDNILEDSRIAKQQLSEIQSRHEEVLKLEKSITEIRDIFVEMAYAVEKQGDQLNCVEYFAGKATENVDSGRCDLTNAERKRRNFRKRKYKIIGVLILIFVIFILIAIFV